MLYISLSARKNLKPFKGKKVIKSGSRVALESNPDINIKIKAGEVVDTRFLNKPEDFFNLPLE